MKVVASPAEIQQTEYALYCPQKRLIHVVKGAQKPANNVVLDEENLGDTSDLETAVHLHVDRHCVHSDRKSGKNHVHFCILKHDKEKLLLTFNN